jgi:RHS repeat-associated protein
MPVIETARDPRLSGSVKHIRYAYDLNVVVGFAVDAFDHPTGQNVARVRWDSDHKPKLVYANGKANRFEYGTVQEEIGMLKRAVNSFGGATDYTYTWNGLVLSEDDPLGRLTTYTRRSDGRLMSITTPGGSVTTYTRDTAGYIMSVNRNGKTTSHIRDAQKRITRTNHPDGTYETWTSNSYGQKLTHRLRDATTQSWNYNPAGLLITHTDPTGVVTTYTYDTLNRLASETRGSGTGLEQTTSYLYNDRGQITQITHPDATTTQHVYDDNGNRVGTMDERGILTTRTYDSLGRMTSETTASGTAKAQTTIYDYTSSVGGGCGCNTGGLPITITYPDGSVTLNTYDKEWRLTSTTVAFGTAYAATTSHTYDVAGQKLSTTDPLGRVTTYAYDLDGRLISETRATGTGIALTTNRSYSVDGNLTSVTEAFGTTFAVTTAMTYDTMDRMVSTTRAFGTAIAATTTYAYNSLGQRASTTDPLGRVTTYGYDGFGRPRDTILPDGTIFRTEYDALSRPIQSISAVGLAEQATTSTTYDNRDRVVTQTDPTGVTTTNTYWPGGLLKSLTTGAGRKVDYFYDENDNITHVVTAPGTAEQTSTVTVYDSRNRPSSVTEAAGTAEAVATYYAYYPQGWVYTVTKPFTPVNITTTYTYDLVGNLLTTKAADNVVTSTRTYDALNRLLTDKDGKNQTISYAYDALGRMTSYTDAKGATFAFAYDLLGRQILRTEPDTTWQSYTYDVAGRLLVHRKADGKTKTHVYGNAQRDFLTRVDYSNGEPSRLMEYDRLGRMLSAVNGSSTVTRSYDEAGRLTSETQALAGGPTGSFVYEYNTATDDGNLKKHTRPNGSQIDYAWNARNLLDSVTSDGPPPVADYEYNLRNQIVSTTIENNIFTATRHYDNAGRLDGITHAGIVETTDYDLSPDGRRTGITRNGDAESYGYDNARQVANANYGGLSTTQSWNYDPAGNRQNATTNGVVTTYQANAVNEYFSITGGGHVPPAPTYDDNGNATTWNVRPQGSSGLASFVFTWNINNELVAATVSPLPLGEGQGEGAQYAYDALGRRVKRVETIGGVTTTTWSFYNGWNVELEHSGAAYTRRHTWGLDLSNSLQGAGGVGGLLMVEHLPHLPLGDGGGEGASGLAEAYFPTFDGNGNITAWFDATGAVIARQRYDAFGNLLSQTGIAPSNYAFSTKPIERVTGLYYYGYRYYDPVTGRWNNRDPIGEAGGVNLYGFVGNAGTSNFDLFGFQSLPAENEDPNSLRPNPLAQPAGLDKLPPAGKLIEKPGVIYTGNCVGFALRDFYKVEIWDESSWENALKYIPKGCRKVTCDGVDAGHTRCKDGECDMVVFLALSKTNTPHYHAMGRKIGTQFGWSSTIFHYTRRTSDNKAVKGLTPIDDIIDPQAHVEEYFPALLDKTKKREKFCFCCKCRDDKVQ